MKSLKLVVAGRRTVLSTSTLLSVQCTHHHRGEDDKMLMQVA